MLPCLRLAAQHNIKHLRLLGLQAHAHNSRTHTAGECGGTSKCGILPNVRKTQSNTQANAHARTHTLSQSKARRAQCCASRYERLAQAITFVRPVWVRLQTSAARGGGATAVRRDSQSLAKKSESRLPGGAFTSFKLVRSNILFLRKRQWSCRRSEPSVLLPISDSGRVGTKHHVVLRSIKKAFQPQTKKIKGCCR